MSDNLSIVYYTASREKCESKVIEQILKVKGDIPVISVSQKPLDFGTNICVGEIGHNYQNAFLQALRGCQEAKTPYVAMCESDCLYPPGYFDFEPKDLNTIYTYDNVWLMWDRENRTRFYKHGTTAGSIILGREFYIKLMENGMPDFFDKSLKWETFTGEPLINIKTRQGVSFGTTLTKGVNPKNSFPLWGTPNEIRTKYFNTCQE
jgi:hypothetical protein